MTCGNNISKKDFGTILVERRKACGYKSHDALAEKLNLQGGRKKVERWESGKSEPSSSELKELCAVLNCDPEYLWGDIKETRKEISSVASVTGLSELAIRALSSICANEEHSIISVANIVSHILENPAFYEMASFILGSESHHIAHQTKEIVDTFIDPSKKEERHKLEKDEIALVSKIKEAAEFCGYTIVDAKGMQQVMQYQVRQRMEKVVNETITIIDNELSELLQEEKKQAIRSAMHE